MKLDISNHSGRFIPAFFVSAFFFLFLLYAFAPAVTLGKLAWHLPATDVENWNYIVGSMVGRLIANSLFLCSGVVLISLFLGLSLAIALESVPSKYQGICEILLTLPMSLPIYLYSFIYVGVFEWASPFSQVLRFITRDTIGFVSVKNMLGAMMIFSLALYPYILLPVRLSLRGRAASLLKISRLAGRTRLRLWSDVLRALSMKAIYVGAIIIAMECLSEFGAVSMLGIDTFTTAIYTAWASFYSLEIAARLGLILMLFIIPLNLLEQRLKRTQLSSEVTKATEQRGSKLSSLWIATVIFFALVIPLLQLVSWLMTPVFHEVLRYDADAMISLSLMTIALGVLCGVIVYGLSLLLTIILRFYRKYLCFHTPRKWLNLSLYGYAIPGNLLAIAFLGVGQYFIASYSMFAALGLLVAALCLKFFRTCLKKAEVGDEFIDNSMVKVGRLHHEKRPFKFLKIVYVPMLNPYLFYGFLFVVIEVMKELPLTMILRPMGVNTLSTKLFELTSEGEWVSAAPYAMALLVICCLFHVTVSQVMMKKVSKAGAQ